MNKFPRLILLVAASLGAAAVLSAQTETRPPGGRGPRGGGPGGPGHGRGPGHPIVRVIDRDGDRTLTATELANAPAALRTLDADGDGNVSVAELHPPRPGRAPNPPVDAPERPSRETRTPGFDPLMLALDADSDGALSAAEIAKAETSLKALDANGDGALSLDEFRPLPPAN